MHVVARIRFGTLLDWAWSPLVMGQAPAPRAGRRRPRTSRPAKAQSRPHGQRVKVDPAAVTVEDGDTVMIHWPDSRRPRSCGSWASTRPRPAGWSTTCRSTSRSARRRTRFRAGRVRRRQRDRAACGARRSTPMTERSPICSSTAAITRSWRSRPVYHRDGQPLRRQRLAQGSRRGHGRRQGHRPLALRAAAPVSGPGCAT